MRVVLEKTDLIALLGKALKRTLTEEDVEINLEAFEVTIHDATGILIKDEIVEEPATPTTAKPKTVTLPAENEEDLTMEELAERNRRLAAQAPAVGRKGADTKVKRARMAGEYDQPLPPVNPLTGDDE